MNGKKLYRVRNDSMIAGICTGLGAYLDLDPNIIRIICVAGCCVGGLPIILYILAAIFLPEVPDAAMARGQAPSQNYSPVVDIPPENINNTNDKDII
ncbi:MAG: PspC domain-containing protein [Ruminococcus sp.]|uniref:PspC domain-containing protein n=1 Tax=Ruminococcus sp. TaxID=41978 RepID=UPI0025E3B828|nr:PspC domain-containing protein [Ruminococcus sp.]MBO4866620.1 PspC domain-containing protein [Ruminococcus sp.]